MQRRSPLCLWRTTCLWWTRGSEEPKSQGIPTSGSVGIYLTHELSTKSKCIIRYWSPIDEVIRESVVLRGIKVRLLISFWKKTHPLTFNFVSSLKSLCWQLHNCSLEVVCFPLPKNQYISVKSSDYFNNLEHKECVISVRTYFCRGFLVTRKKKRTINIFSTTTNMWWLIMLYTLVSYGIVYLCCYW